MCQFLWIQCDPLLFIFDLNNEVYINQEVSVELLKRLDSIALIAFEAKGFVKYGFGRYTRLSYYA